MRQICVILLTILSLACLASAQQTASDVSTNSQTSGSTQPDTLTSSGTANYIPIWTTSTDLGNSILYQTNGNVGIGNTSPAYKLDVDGDASVNGEYRILGQSALSLGSRNSQGNIFVGVGPGYTGSESYQDVLVGLGAGHEITSGYQNAFVGYHAGYNATTGLQNSYFGDFAGSENTTGSGNTFLGTGVGVYNASTGSNNVYIGIDSGIGSNGNDNVVIGKRAGLANSGGNNDIYIGSGAGCSSSCSESKTIRIGTAGAQSAVYMAGIYGVNVDGIPVQINSNGQLGVATSSLRFKQQVRDMGDSTDALIKLRPVTFLYKPEYADGEPTLQYGLIAEEVAKVYPELVAYDKDGQPYSVRYQYLSTMLLNELQKQHAVVSVQQGVIETQQQQVNTLYSPIGGQWIHNAYTYTAFSAAGAQGILTTPTPGTQLAGTTVTFGWTAGMGATSYWLDTGSTSGGNQYYQSGDLGNVLTTTVSGLPTDGSTVYVTLYSKIGGTWYHTVYTYMAGP